MATLLNSSSAIAAGNIAFESIQDSDELARLRHLTIVFSVIRMIH